MLPTIQYNTLISLLLASHDRQKVRQYLSDRANSKQSYHICHLYSMLALNCNLTPQNQLINDMVSKVKEISERHMAAKLQS